MNETQLANIKRKVQERTYNENLGMERTVDGVLRDLGLSADTGKISRIAQGLRDIIAMGREPGSVEFNPPIEESE